MPDREKIIAELQEYHDKEWTDERMDGLRERNIRKRVTGNALALLKEQEGIVPYIDIDEAKCPVCKVKLTRQELLGDDVLFEDFFDYCPHCGKPVLWEGR